MPRMPASKTTKRDTLSISQLNRQAKRLLEGNFPSVWVEGEISNLARPSSGHWYFSLKDSSAQVRCAMFRSSNARLRFEADAGQQVMARAKLSLYEARGDYQLIVEHMELAGDGALARKFEQLKAQLSQEGLFDPDIKKPIPTLPQHIAVITSPTGAAIHDILTVLKRRFPGIPVTLLPVAVQGATAGAEIEKALNTANELARDGTYNFDVIICGRGGGSLEDLWAFNEERVARAIYASELPVISAVGHEIDFTIADFVADVRAATPSAAAELVSPDAEDMAAGFAGYEELITRQALNQLKNLKQQLDASKSRLRHPGSRLQEHNQRLDELEIRLVNGWKNSNKHRSMGLALLNSRLQQQTPNHKISKSAEKLAYLYRRLEQQTQNHLQKTQQKLQTNMQLLDAVSPLATLNRGYSIVTDENSNVITETSQVKNGHSVRTRLSKGSFTSQVIAVDKS